jgi:sensor domain CHASE-containing protein
VAQKRRQQLFDSSLKGLTEQDEEKQKIEEVLTLLGLEQLWDESPLVQAERAKAEAKGKAEGLEVLRSIG